MTSALGYHRNLFVFCCLANQLQMLSSLHFLHDPAVTLQIERFYEEEIDRRDGDVEEKISDNETLAEESYNIFEKCLTNLVRRLLLFIF